MFGVFMNVFISNEFYKKQAIIPQASPIAPPAARSEG